MAHSRLTEKRGKLSKRTIKSTKMMLSASKAVRGVLSKAVLGRTELKKMVYF